MRELKLKAKAKINLGLDVVRKREDGYHEVRMIMQMINIGKNTAANKSKIRNGSRYNLPVRFLPFCGQSVPACHLALITLLLLLVFLYSVKIKLAL